MRNCATIPRYECVCYSLIRTYVCVSLVVVQVKNEMLVAMEGFDTSDSDNVVVIGATNM